MRQGIQLYVDERSMSYKVRTKPVAWNYALTRRTRRWTPWVHVAQLMLVLGERLSEPAGMAQLHDLEPDRLLITSSRQKIDYWKNSRGVFAR